MSALIIVEAVLPEAVALANTLPKAVCPSLKLSTFVWVIVGLVVFEFTDLVSYDGGLEGPESTIAVNASLFLTCHEYVQNILKLLLTQFDIENDGIVGFEVATVVDSKVEKPMIVESEFVKPDLDIKHSIVCKELAVSDVLDKLTEAFEDVVLEEIIVVAPLFKI